MMCSVTKATAIQFIDGKCHNNKEMESRKTALPSYYACVSRDLLLVPSGVDTHTCKHTDFRGQNDFKKPGARFPGLKIFSLFGFCKFHWRNFYISSRLS